MQPSDFASFFGQSEDELLMQMMAVTLAAVVVCGLVSLALYILRSFSLYTVAKRRGLSNYGLAWVPVAYVWTLGAIVDQYDASHGMKRKWRVALLTLALVGVGVSILAYYGCFAMLIGTMSDLNRMQEVDPTALIQTFVAYWLSLIPISMAAGALNICMMVCYYKLFESCRPRLAVCYLLLSLLIPFGLVIILLCCRKWDEGMRMPVAAGHSGDAAGMEEAGLLPADFATGGNDETPVENDNRI